MRSGADHRQSGVDHDKIQAEFLRTLSAFAGTRFWTPELPMSLRSRACIFVAILATALPVAHAQAQPSDAGAAALSVMPMPSSVAVQSGELELDGRFGVKFEGYSEPRLLRARERFLARLSAETGILFGMESPDGAPGLVIHAQRASAPVQKLGEDESYHLAVSSAGMELSAANPLGVLRGLQTILQMVRATGQGFAIPYAVLDDQPRFPWRGLMIDSSRHFIPLPVILQNLDAMEAVKLNVFHWHLSDDQGFRAESRAFPLLQEKGSNGQFYTQEQIREVIGYARDRGIRVVPEFDMPGHATSWLVGYPQLGSGKGPYRIVDRFGVFDGAMDPTRESTYLFLNRFIGEMSALFPDAYFHIGGDECNGKEWDANARIQQFMKLHHLRDDAALQAYFTARVEHLVAAHGKTMEGWDEVLQPETPKQVVIQSWRGRESLLNAAQRGYRVLLSTGYYLDLIQPAAEHYAVDPLAGISDKLTPAQTKNVLGGEAAMWSEYVDGQTINSRIWPRMAAIAERLWSPAEVTDVESMDRRMDVFSVRLAAWGVNPRATTETMLETMSGERNPVALRVLASAVQPPAGYVRGGLREYFTYTPLNRLVDAVPPESVAARRFARLAGRIAAGTATRAEREEAEAMLRQWRASEQALAPMLDRSAMTAELGPVSATLSRVAAMGLDALLEIEAGQHSTPEMTAEWESELKAAEKPQAVLTLPIVAPVRALVEAAAGSARR